MFDSDIMTVNDKSIQMDTSAIIKDDRTYIPVRFVAEALGLTVEWIQ
ncbi:MAG: copper amine oxidase N-terminal domain-containing protein [Clostridiales bacterium]|nr:copper amine oxidase N-terminal domain-containing protein [Clostridiales bacterium]